MFWVTVGLASHWPCVTDSVVYPPTGSKANVREIISPPMLQQEYVWSPFIDVTDLEQLAYRLSDWRDMDSLIMWLTPNTQWSLTRLGPAALDRDDLSRPLTSFPWPLTWWPGNSSWRLTGREVDWRWLSSSAAVVDEADTRRRGIMTVWMSLEKHTRFLCQSTTPSHTISQYSLLMIVFLWT